MQVRPGARAQSRADRTNGFSRVDLSRESARHRELSGSQRQFIGFDFLLYAARELIENGKKILFG